MLFSKLKKISQPIINKKPGYEILTEKATKRGLLSGPQMIRKIKCKQCGSISYNTHDVRYLYCAKCNIFHAK